jgi:hypothetical protein
MLCVGDVTGRGLLAAGLMGKMRQAINMASMYEPDPARLLDAIDFQLRTRGSQALVTAFVGILAPDGKSMRYANAGHPPPLLRRAGEIEELCSTGLPIGLRDAAERETTVELSLEGAELLALYTDGLTEGTRDLAFGERRLREVISTDAILNVRNPAQFLCEACLPFVLAEEFADFHLDELEELFVVNHVALVQEHDDVRNADLLHEQNVLAGLRHRTVGRGDDEDGAVHLRRAGDHVLDVVGVARAVDVRVVALGRLVLLVRDGDRNTALFFFGRVIDVVNVALRDVGVLGGEAVDDCRGKRGLTMVDVPRRSDVYVRFATFEFSLRHLNVYLPYT